jgi:peptide/nickel transport system permease protein
MRTLQFVAKRLSGSKKAMFGAGMLLLLIMVGVLAPLIAHGNPQAVVGPLNAPPSLKHLLGTTGQGGDVFRQVAWGARDSLTVGLLTGLGVTIIGVSIGLIGAYVGGIVDHLLTLLTNIFLVIPGLPLLVVMAAFLPHSTLSIIFVLAIAGWAGTARVIRSQALSVVKRDYVSAAKVIGEPGVRIVVVEVLPNLASLIASGLFGAVAYGIAAQAALEFLGLGNLDSVSWGTILYWASNNAGLLQGAWWEFVPAGACIAAASGSLALLNFAVDEVTNPRLRRFRLPKSSRLKAVRDVSEEPDAA